MSELRDCFGSEARRQRQALKDAIEIARPIASFMSPTGVLALRSIDERMAARACEEGDAHRLDTAYKCRICGRTLQQLFDRWRHKKMRRQLRRGRSAQFISPANRQRSARA